MSDVVMPACGAGLIMNHAVRTSNMALFKGLLANKVHYGLADDELSTPFNACYQFDRPDVLKYMLAYKASMVRMAAANVHTNGMYFSGVLSKQSYYEDAILSASQWEIKSSECIGAFKQAVDGTLDPQSSDVHVKPHTENWYDTTNVCSCWRACFDCGRTFVAPGECYRSKSGGLHSVHIRRRVRTFWTKCCRLYVQTDRRTV